MNPGCGKKRNLAWSNTMYFRKFFLISAFAISNSAAGDIVTVVDAIETVTSNISVPTSPNGRLMFRPCDGVCEENFIAVRLTPETTYHVYDGTVDFVEFRRQFFNLRRGGEGYALVSFDTESKTATSIRIGS
jgi:hypothetical protein